MRSLNWTSSPVVRRCVAAFGVVAFAACSDASIAQEPTAEDASARAAFVLVEASIPVYVEDAQSRVNPELALTAPAAADLSPEGQAAFVGHLELFPEALQFMLERSLPGRETPQSEPLQQLLQQSVSIDVSAYLPANYEDRSIVDRVGSELSGKFADAELRELGAFFETSAGSELIYRMTRQVVLDSEVDEADFSPAAMQEIEAFFETPTGGRFFDSADWTWHMVQREIEYEMQTAGLPMFLAFVYRSCEIAGIVCDSPMDPRMQVMVPAPR